MKYLSLLILCLLFGCTKKPAALPDITTGLVVNIAFDGNVIDSVSRVNGVINNATFATDHHGNAGKAMYFNPADSSTVNFGALPLASFDSSNEFTISCWVKVADTSTNIAVLSKRSETGPYEYSLDNHFTHNTFALDNWVSSGATSVYGTDPLSAAAAISTGQWQHLAYVADGSSLRVYVNGTLQSGADLHNSNYAFGTTSAPFVVGNGGGYGKDYYFNGCIDDIRIYSRALPANAVQYLAKL